jgi:cytochrome c oxidase subunit IV
MDLIRLNGINDEQIEKSLAYLKSQSELVDIDDVDGYDNWNAFFIMFCIKAGNQ